MSALLLIILVTTPQQRLHAARDAFENSNYEKAVALAQSILAEQPADVILRQDARALLAFSLFYEHHEAEARVALGKLFSENLAYPIDKDLLNPTLVHFCENERAAFIGAKPAPTVAPPPRVEAVTTVAPVQTLGDRQPWLRIFPLGVGHFVNHDRWGGGLFLGSELLLAGANVTGALLRYRAREPSGLYRPNSNAQALEIVQDAAALTLIAVCAIEIIDAFVWSPARGRRTLQAGEKK